MCAHCAWGIYMYVVTWLFAPAWLALHCIVVYGFCFSICCDGPVCGMCMYSMFHCCISFMMVPINTAS